MQMSLIMLLVLSSMTAVIVGGFLYQWIGAHCDRRRYARTGRWVKIDNGCQLYLLEMGSGGPTVVFESGLAAMSLSWHDIQGEVAKFTRAVSYDRGGLGWSTRARSPRMPANIARELDEMLERARIEPPFVLVGHSFGGLVARRFALLYPEKVAGVVLVDPMRPVEWPPWDPSRQGLLDRGRMLALYGAPIARCGLARLAMTSLLCPDGKGSRYLAGKTGGFAVSMLRWVKSEMEKTPREVWPAVAAHLSKPAYYKGLGAHLRALPDAMREMCDAEAIRGIPVTLLTPGSAAKLNTESLNQLGDNVTDVLAPGSAHWVHADDPKLVVDSIRAMVEVARRTSDSRETDTIEVFA